MNYFLRELKIISEKYIVVIMLLFNWLLIGCSPTMVEQTFEIQATISPTPSIIEATTSLIIPVATTSVTTIPTPTITATPKPTFTPSPSTTPISPTTTPTVQLATEIQSQCGSVSPLTPETIEILRGFLLRSNHLEENKGLYVLGDEGLDQPLTFVPDIESLLIWPYPSPNREWIAYDSSDIQDAIWSREITVWNPSTNEAITRLFTFDANWFVGDSIYWGNDNQLIIPLNYEEELFRWWVWSPFSGDEREILVELSGLGNQRERYGTSSILDPLLEMVAYPCELCDEGEYVIKDIESGETMWFIDLGSNPSPHHRSTAYWSPDGHFLTVISGQLNQLLFFNREGEKIHQISLPVLDSPSGLTIFNQSWSPNGQYLAFLRVTSLAGTYEDTLTYIDIQSGQVIDLCVNGRTGFPIWSPDSTKIAFAQQIESGELPQLISIVDIHSGDVVQLYDADGRNLVGWIDLPSARE
ncbi:MAG: hypothetical protein OT477_18810 [Chloroflexi bacterium]|nr:hypothetical protein [Chloroflexota bacterium]